MKFRKKSKSKVKTYGLRKFDKIRHFMENLENVSGGGRAKMQKSHHPSATKWYRFHVNPSNINGDISPGLRHCKNLCLTKEKERYERLRLCVLPPNLY